MNLSDNALHRLKDVVAEPDLSGTRYRIVRPAGSGGMGAVYVAEDTVLKRHVALKVIQPAEAYLDAGAADRLLEEARILARLEHPGIVPVHDAGVLPDGNVFYTMKFVEGRQLEANAPQTDLLRTFQRICEAVAFAHSQGIVHRDLKPENVMVGAFGEVLVMDWGVAKVLGRFDEAQGTVVGTADFMAPEQARGETGNIDARSDVFALGAILRFLLNGKTVPKALKAVCDRAQARDAAERYSGALDLKREIGRFMDGEPVEAYPESVPERARRIVVNNPMAFALVAAYLAMRILVFLFLEI